MSYIESNWVNNVTTVDADKMNNIEAGIAGHDAQLADMSAQVISQNNMLPNNLRIAYQYNYFINQEKMDLLKSLGFNCVVITKMIPNRPYNMYDIQQTLTFLDFLLANGIKAILYTDTNNITGTNGGVVATEQSWIASIQNHKSIIGFYAYDEPQGNGISVSLQELAYVNIKAVTNKPVFVSDTFAIDFQTTPVDNYTSNSFDVFIYVNYMNTTSDLLLTSGERKRKIISDLIGLQNKVWQSSPKLIIPVLPFFTQPAVNFDLITKELLQDYIDAYSLFGFNNFAMFAFDSQVYGNIGVWPDTLDNSSVLQSFCINFWTLLYKNNQEIAVLKPKGFDLNKSFYSSQNMSYNLTTAATKYEKISVNTGYGIGEIVIKINVNSSSKELHLMSVTGNGFDNLTRTITHSISFDGITYEQESTEYFVATNGGFVITSTHNIPPNIKTILCKFQLNFNGNNNDTTTLKNYIGFLMLGSSIC